MAQSRRDHLIDTALGLFNRDGYHATGIDRILAESGVAKMTLYKHFKSKNGLILATLLRRDERWLVWFRGALERHARNHQGPGAPLMAVFDALEEWFASKEFYGCMFIKAAAEYPDMDDPIHAAAALHHRNIMAELRQLAERAGTKRPARLAREIMLLIEGAIAVTQVNGASVGAAREAARVAQILIDQATRPDA